MPRNYVKVLVDKRKGGPLIERFTNKIKISENGCWLWTGAQIKGYGTMKVDGQHRQATHIAWNLFKREDVTDGMTTDHFKCLTTLCVNPNHIRILSRSLNSADNKWANERRAATHCPHGHPYDGDNTLARKLPTGNAGRGCKACASIANRAYQRAKRLNAHGVHTTYREQLAIIKARPTKQYKKRKVVT